MTYAFQNNDIILSTLLISTIRNDALTKITHERPISMNVADKRNVQKEMRCTKCCHTSTITERLNLRDCQQHLVLLSFYELVTYCRVTNRYNKIYQKSLFESKQTRPYCSDGTQTVESLRISTYNIDDSHPAFREIISICQPNIYQQTSE